MNERETRLPVLLPDSDAYTPSGRRLLVALGVVEPDPLRVEAQAWLRSHRGPATEATVAVRKQLGGDFPPAFYEAAARMRACPWKGRLK